MAKKADNGFGIPEHSLESFARRILPVIQQFYDSEEGKQEFEAWKKQQAKENTKQDDNNEMKTERNDLL